MRKDKKLYIFIFIISFISILVCSKNSPLYPFNDWVDENAFMTVGKSWTHGLIPYKDLFEQKGPFLYLIFALSSLISEKTFIGVFVFEIISMFFTLVFASKIVNLYIDKKYNYYILPLFVSIITSSKFFACGGSAEEFSFPFIIYSIYVFFKILKDEKSNNKELFFAGLCAGIISMIKFNLLGFWIGFGLFIVIYHFINKDYKMMLKKTFYYLLGISIPIIIFSIYFFVNHGFKDFVKTYIIFNIGGYSFKISMINRIKTIFHLFYGELCTNVIINILTLISLYYLITDKVYVKNKFSKISVFITYVLSFFGIFYGGFAFGYYFLPMTLFIIFGLIISIKNINKNKKIWFICILIISILLLINCHNVPSMKKEKKDYVQYKYAKIINKEKNPTLLNYGSLDGGFYTTSGIIPNTKYFEFQNSYVPNLVESLDIMIKNKEFDFIVIRTYDGYDPRYDAIYNNYELIKEEVQNAGGVDFTYYLYQKKVN